MQKKEEIQKKDKTCFNCDVEGQYKCSKCIIRYCSVACYKQHTDTCKPIKKPSKRPRVEAYTGADTVKRDTLEQLGLSDEVKNHLSNKYLRGMISSIVNDATDVRFALDMGMGDRRLSFVWF